jgi:hypothetical protein
LPGAAAPEDSEVARRLRALGYVSGATPKARYTEADDPKRWSTSIRRCTTRWPPTRRAHD